MLGIITAFYFLRGRIEIEGGRSGKLVPRFSVNQRVVHWLAAGVFVLLALTGLVLLYGRYVLIPLLGPEGFSATAAASKEVHNLFGPIFPFAVVALMVQFGRGNWFRWLDIKWFLKAGGLFGHEIADSGYYNGGQKTWFWLTVLFGIAISVSGLILLFQNFGQGREIMAAAHLVHAVIAIVFIAASLGSHLYRHPWDGGRGRVHDPGLCGLQLGPGAPQPLVRGDGEGRHGRRRGERPRGGPAARRHRLPRLRLATVRRPMPPSRRVEEGWAANERT